MTQVFEEDEECNKIIVGQANEDFTSIRAYYWHDALCREETVTGLVHLQRQDLCRAVLDKSYSVHVWKSASTVGHFDNLNLAFTSQAQEDTQV